MNDDNPDSTAAPGTGPKVVPLQPANPLIAAGDELRRNLDVLVATADTVARLRRAAFLAYKKAGFTDQQALELCCK